MKGVKAGMVFVFKVLLLGIIFSLSTVGNYFIIGVKPAFSLLVGATVVWGLYFMYQYEKRGEKVIDFIKLKENLNRFYCEIAILLALLLTFGIIFLFSKIPYTDYYIGKLGYYVERDGKKRISINGMCKLKNSKALLKGLREHKEDIGVCKGGKIKSGNIIDYHYACGFNLDNLIFDNLKEKGIKYKWVGEEDLIVYVNKKTQQVIIEVKNKPLPSDVGYLEALFRDNGFSVKVEYKKGKCNFFWGDLCIILH